MDHPMCENGCGFYGSVENKNLCSKCYRDYLKQENININHVNISADHSAVMDPIDKLDRSSITGGICSPSSRTSDDSVSENYRKNNNNNGSNKNRCGSCKRKVGVMGFQCRCGGVYCGMHRYPEEHSCDVDLKKVGRDVLAKQNPLCKGDKLAWRV